MGVFQVVNHGVPSTLLEEMKEVGLRFFRSPWNSSYGTLAIRDPLHPRVMEAGCCQGGGCPRLEDYFDHHTLPEFRRNPSVWPDFPENYRDVVMDYSNNMKLLAQRLLRMISKV
ncbi:hypothetical protein HPP92_019981 [Vanilla planifolia]|uniref:Non-haem dioxygenase N-terminal domain-containing protein n=1 Tax=Vanilla planifolia TaxID=51239 RepID=A0A835UJF5_VANPL|nr:hypothetical protein HPP92_019981 [Vanilla planifolia]